MIPETDSLYGHGGGRSRLFVQFAVTVCGGKNGNRRCLCCGQCLFGHGLGRSHSHQVVGFEGFNFCRVFLDCLLLNALVLDGTHFFAIVFNGQFLSSNDNVNG